MRDNLDFLALSSDQVAARAMPRGKEIDQTLAFLDGRSEADPSIVRAMGWYGIRGRGKTWLRRRIEERLRAADSPRAYATIALDGAEDLEAILSLRVQLARRTRLRFPLFDWAFIRWFQIVYPDADIRQRHANLFTSQRLLSGASGGQAADDILDWMFGVGKEVAGASLEMGLSIVPSINATRNVLGEVFGWFRERSELKPLKERLLYLETLTPEELRSGLAHCLAYDLRTSREAGQWPDGMVLLVDDSDKARPASVPNLLDHSWLEAIVANCPGIDLVLFAAEPSSFHHTDVKIHWHALSQIDKSVIFQTFDAAGIDAFSVYDADLVHGEPLFATFYIESYFGKGSTEGVLARARKRYADALLKDVLPQDRRRLTIAAFAENPRRDEYEELATGILGPDERLLWGRLDKLHHASIVNGRFCVREPLATALRQDIVQRDPDLTSALRRCLMEMIEIDAERGWLSDKSLELLDRLINILDWNDGNTFAFLRRIYKLSLRFEKPAKVRSLIDLIAQKKIQAEIAHDALLELDLMLLDWQSEEARRVGNHSEAYNLALKALNRGQERARTNTTDQLEDMRRGMEVCLSMIAQSHAHTFRPKSKLDPDVSGMMWERHITTFRSNLAFVERELFVAISEAMSRLPDHLSRMNSAFPLADSTHAALNQVRILLEKESISALPALVETIQHLRIAAFEGRSAAGDTHQSSLLAVSACDDALDACIGATRSMGTVGRRAALVPDLYDLGRSHIRAAAELAYSLSLELSSTDHQAFELITRVPDKKAFIRELERIEFDAECAEPLPDGARLTALCTSMLEREGTPLDEVINVCRAFDRAASNPGVVLPEHGAIQVYARFADALLDSGQCREARTAIEFVQEAAERIGPLMYRDPRSHATHRAIIRTKENAARLSQN